MMAELHRFRKTAATLLAAFGALMLAAGFYCLRRPCLYDAIARVRVEKEWSRDKLIPRTYERFDPFWVQTEFELIHSKVILFAVISNLNLTERWSAKVNARTTAELYPILRDKLIIRQERNSSLIEIRAFSEDPREAAELANAVALAYRQHRMEAREQLRKQTHGENELPIAWPVQIIEVAEPRPRRAGPHSVVGVLLVVGGSLSELLALILFIRKQEL